MQPKRRSRREKWQRAGILLALGLSAGCGTVFFLDLESYLFGGNLHSVIPGGVYRSAQPTPERLRGWIHSLPLQSILNLRGVRDAVQPDVAVASRAGIELRHLRLSAQRLPSPAEAEALIHHLDTLPRPLLLHCRAGTDRSGLAAAVAVLLEGGDLDRARSQFHLRFGYPGRRFGSDLPEFLSSYRRFLRSRAALHTPETFRSWVRNDYVAYYYAALLDFESLPASVARNEPFAFEVQITNRSEYPIPMHCDERAGVRLSLVLRRVSRADGDEGLLSKRRYCKDRRMLIPGASMRIAANYNLTRPGRYEFVADLVDEKREHFFEEMGSPVARQSFVVE